MTTLATVNLKELEFVISDLLDDVHFIKVKHNSQRIELWQKCDSKKDKDHCCARKVETLLRWI